MQTRTTSKWIGAIAAALTLTLATPAPHADAVGQEVVQHDHLDQREEGLGLGHPLIDLQLETETGCTPTPPHPPRSHVSETVPA